MFLKEYISEAVNGHHRPGRRMKLQADMNIKEFVSALQYLTGYEVTEPGGYNVDLSGVIAINKSDTYYSGVYFEINGTQYTCIFKEKGNELFAIGKRPVVKRHRNGIDIECGDYKPFIVLQDGIDEINYTV